MLLSNSHYETYVPPFESDIFFPLRVSITPSSSLLDQCLNTISTMRLRPIATPNNATINSDISYRIVRFSYGHQDDFEASRCRWMDGIRAFRRLCYCAYFPVQTQILVAFVFWSPCAYFWRLQVQTKSVAFGVQHYRTLEKQCITVDNYSMSMTDHEDLEI